MKARSGKQRSYDRKTIVRSERYLRAQLTRVPNVNYCKILPTTLFLDLRQDIAGPGEPFNQRSQELSIESQLAGVGELFELNVLNA